MEAVEGLARQYCVRPSIPTLAQAGSTSSKISVRRCRCG
ncbi:hypothetical protein I553_4567 [Mycobacterium xenopi 4042]|uniref:Uncharacterized protein n=1 Tax=Mycobacterium xenopi 4042 TaxID=1299334 RepID=X8AHJ1_MYCXE|nr:hypothetical protein I553_4567 [Mycobacterium xenopi 4042]